MSASLQGAMDDLIQVFHQYSGKEGDKYKLSKKELKNMLQKEFPELFSGSLASSAVEMTLKDLDENGDGEVDFQEFVVLVAEMTVMLNEFFVDLIKDCEQAE